MANAAANAEAGSAGITRREFLYYVWGASIALITAQSVGLTVWLLIPRFREGEFGGIFEISASEVPDINAEPVNFPEGRFWLVNVDSTQQSPLMEPSPQDERVIKGVAAIYKVCTHLGCIYSWTPTNNRFECPCHGSKYRLDGRRIEAPAPRSLDRFRIQALDADKNPIAGAESAPLDDFDGFYAALELPDDAEFLNIDTGDREDGPSQAPLCTFTGSCP